MPPSWVLFLRKAESKVKSQRELFLFFIRVGGVKVWGIFANIRTGLLSGNYYGFRKAFPAAKHIWTGATPGRIYSEALSIKNKIWQSFRSCIIHEGSAAAKGFAIVPGAATAGRESPGRRGDRKASPGRLSQATRKLKNRQQNFLIIPTSVEAENCIYRNQGDCQKGRERISRAGRKIFPRG